MQILFCDSPGILRVIYLVKMILNIVRFVLPICLILMVSLDIYKNILNGYGENKDVTIKKTMDRVLACIIVFCVPTIVNLLFSILSEIDISVGTYKDTLAICYQEVTPELIQELELLDKLKLDEEAEEERIKKLTIANSFEAKLKAQAEANAKRLNSNGTWNEHLTDLKKQNGVYIKDGVFYKPSGASGHQCPEDGKGKQSGYNNDGGYNNYFYNMLLAFQEGAKKAGFGFKIDSDGCRSYQEQVDTANRYKNEPGRAASPGNSNHGWGIASDLSFNNTASENWCHQHAAEYGLTFPLLNASYPESWHVEPLYLAPKRMR